MDAWDGMGFCCLTGLTWEALAILADADLLAPGALDEGNLVGFGFVIIF